MKKLTCLCLLTILLMSCLSGCGKAETADKKLTVTASEWWELGGEDLDPVVFSPVKKGDEVYNGYSSVITVKSVSEDKIVLAIDGGLVEPNEDGSINLNREPLKKLTLEPGQSVELASQTMDAGVHIMISFE